MFCLIYFMVCSWFWKMLVRWLASWSRFDFSNKCDNMDFGDKDLFFMMFLLRWLFFIWIYTSAPVNYDCHHYCNRRFPRLQTDQTQWNDVEHLGGEFYGQKPPGTWRIFNKQQAQKQTCCHVNTPCMYKKQIDCIIYCLLYFGIFAKIVTPFWWWSTSFSVAASSRRFTICRCRMPVWSSSFRKGRIFNRNLYLSNVQISAQTSWPTKFWCLKKKTHPKKGPF